MDEELAVGPVLECGPLLEGGQHSGDGGEVEALEQGAQVDA